MKYVPTAMMVAKEVSQNLFFALKVAFCESSLKFLLWYFTIFLISFSDGKVKHLPDGQSFIFDFPINYNQ